MRFRPYFGIGPRVYVTRARPRAGCLVASGVLVLLLTLARALAGQITAVAAMRGGDAEVFIGNPTPGPLSVTVALFRDATGDAGPVTLGPAVQALISPASFTLAPGEHQIVRLRVREAVAPGELLRLVTVLDPTPAAPATPGARLLVVLRIITKVRVEASP